MQISQTAQLVENLKYKKYQVMLCIGDLHLIFFNKSYYYFISGVIGYVKQLLFSIFELIHIAIISLFWEHC